MCSSPRGRGGGLSDRIDHRFPTESSVGRESPAVFWAQLTRDSGVATARAVRDRASRRLRAMTHGGSSPGAIFTSSGTKEDERTFLQRVASEDSRRRDGGTGPAQ